MLCTCGHSELVHDEEGWCTVCGCRGVTCAAINALDRAQLHRFFAELNADARRVFEARVR